VHTSQTFPPLSSLNRTALATAMYTFALDPLHDSVGMLLVLDYYALATNEPRYDQWLIDMVESNTISLCLTHPGSSTATGRLLDMPNWMFSYALACFRRYQETGQEVRRTQATEALRNAVLSFPQVIEQLLSSVGIDRNGQSCQYDWMTVLRTTGKQAWMIRNELTRLENGEMSDDIDRSVTKIIEIFISLNSRIWACDRALHWVYTTIQALNDADFSVASVPCVALSRYRNFETSDYENKFTLLPNENLVDPGLLAQALIVETHRPRFFRHAEEHGADLGTLQGDGNGRDLFEARNVLAGPPTNIIDPDLPFAEVFWRSFLPWNHVEGVQAPRR
jgi:hypothetical protein